MSANVPTIYEDVEVKYETKETPEAQLLIVHIPDGFAKEHIGAKVEFDHRKIRVFGEQPLRNDRTIRFNLVHQVPPTCDINGIKGKFDGGIVTITIQKKLISKEVPNQKPQQSATREAESSHANNKETIAPKSTIGDKAKDKSTTSEVKDHKAIVQSKEEVDNDTSKLPKVEEKTMPQKGQEEKKVEKERVVVKEVTKEDTNNTSESRKECKNDVVERVVKEVTKEGSSEIKEDRKESSKVEESFVDAKFTKEEEKEKEKKRKGSFGAVEESYGKSIPESRFKRIKEVVASASEAVTSVTKKFNDEDKQKLIYMSAAVVMVALGVYASYKFRSSPRL
ncbi:PREDICTED: inactive protein RESTRICTED TEV MOVEMENT 2-like isoform X2 [Lupinus angustifolius]|uniref:inactive protein RESTRICTED TEV MOVEMENT 2-like isoform X2 n=1 Tax=Lupinus angustifolius TaxID=3871 RepID=UPI00092F65C5|nr:PREDICTED: inactive protein RESTRICTED TEV MOVEMENT 2-like isoform X2 [Lupinus angustifolius]